MTKNALHKVLTLAKISVLLASARGLTCFSEMKLLLQAGLLCMLGVVVSLTTWTKYYKESCNDNIHRPTSGYLYRMTTRTRLECSARCTADATCVSYFHSQHVVTGNCQMHDIFQFVTAQSPYTESLPNTSYYVVPASITPGCPTGSEWVTHVLPASLGVFHLKIIANGSVDRQTAISYCTELGGYLPKITTIEKLNYFRDRFLACPYMRAYDYFVDGDNLGSSADWWAADAWKTHKGNQMLMSQGDFWAVGRPNNPDFEHCMWISNLHNFYLDDRNCVVSPGSTIQTMCEISHE